MPEIHDTPSDQPSIGDSSADSSADSPAVRPPEEQESADHDADDDLDDRFSEEDDAEPDSSFKISSVVEPLGDAANAAGESVDHWLPGAAGDTAPVMKSIVETVEVFDGMGATADNTAWWASAKFDSARDVFGDLAERVRDAKEDIPEPTENPEDK